MSYYETPQQIVNDYYNGKLEETYPIMVEAIRIIIEKEITISTNNVENA